MAPVRLTVDRSFSGKRLDAFLSKALPGMSLERARVLADAGRVRIRGKVAKAVRKLWGGEEVEVDLPAPRRAPQVEGPAIPVLYEDDTLLVINKPPGLVVEPDGAAPSLVELVASQQRGFDVNGEALPGVAHRLDRETSGCLALAKTDAGLAAIEQAFQQKQVEKTYLALVLGSPPDRDRFDTPYARNPQNPRQYTTRVPSPRRAVLSYETKERFPGVGLSLVEVRLETGRTHQIRVQMFEAGFPVLADPLYGPLEVRAHPLAKQLGRLALHAARLKLNDVSVEAPLPEDFQRALDAARASR